MWFTNRSDTNRPVQAQKRARSLKFRIYVEEELYYPGSENEGADQLRGYRDSPVAKHGFGLRPGNVCRIKCFYGFHFLIPFR